MNLLLIVLYTLDLVHPPSNVQYQLLLSMYVHNEPIIVHTRPGTSALPRSVSPPSFYVHNEPIIVQYTLDLVLLLSHVQYHLLSMGTMNLLLYSTTHNHLIHLLLSMYTMKFSLYSTVHNKLTIV